MTREPRPSTLPLVPPSSTRFAILFGPAGFADDVRGLPPEGELDRRVAVDAPAVLRDLGSAALALIVVHHDRAAILPALRPGRLIPSTGIRPVPVVVVGCPDAVAASDALAQGAEFAARVDASEGEIAALVRAALELRDLSVLSLKDDLTAAWNRRYFEECLQQSVSRASADAEPVSLIFMDIDNLKAVNVRHGHSMGSRVLREVAGRLIRTVRATDAVMRYGGDEFCVLLPGLDINQALEVAERLREVVASEAFRVDAVTAVQLTASFGIACFPDHATDAHGLVAAADAAMLSIKDQRKNGIHVAGQP